MQTPTPINDDRLTPDMERIRNGAQQLFRRNYNDREITRVENADVALDPPERHFYAELIDGVWCWVNGCAECNGEPRCWTTYIECYTHNVCRSCNTPRSQLAKPPHGGQNGWQCQPCNAAEHEAEKAAALAAMPDDFCAHEYQHEDTPRCPYCNFELHVESEDISGMLDSEQEEECPRCDHVFMIEAECSISYSTSRK